MGGTTRRMRGRGQASFALLTSLVVLSSFFIVAGAQVASASQCGQVNNPPTCSLQFRFENPAKSGIYNPPAPGYSSPHQAAVGETITSTDLDPSGPPVTVEVEDVGHRDTNYGGQITVALAAGSGLSGKGYQQAGPRQPCPCTVTAVGGAASFDLSINTKGYFQLTATASPGNGINPNPITSGAFRIQADECASGQPCHDSFQTLMEADLTNGGSGTVGLSVAIDGVDSRPPLNGSGLTSCSTDGTLAPFVVFTDPFFHAPAEWTVDEVRATSATTKLLVIRIDKAWRQLVLDKGASSYRPCITALVTFPTWQNSPLTQRGAEYTGLAPDCSKAITYFCLAYVKSNKSGDVIEGISLPSGSIVGDPRGH